MKTWRGHTMTVYLRLLSAEHDRRYTGKSIVP